MVDFKGRWQDLKWDLQEQELQKLGSLYERVNPHIFGEAVLTNFMVNKECLVENWYHWSGMAGSDGDFVYVGYFNSIGLHVNRHRFDYMSPDLRACLFRKFDIFPED